VNTAGAGIVLTFQIWRRISNQAPGYQSLRRGFQGPAAQCEGSDLQKRSSFMLGLTHWRWHLDSVFFVIKMVHETRGIELENMQG